MSRRKVAPWLLAASVFLTGATSLLTGMGSSAHAITSVEELRDVDSSSWAYQALSDLVEKYDVIEGYPDYTFKGKRPATRYEMAAALNALIKAVGRDLARLGAEKANKSDLATLARLQEEFRNELAAINARTTALESRASAIEAKNTEQDNRLDLLEKTQLHGDLSFGVLADTTGNGTSTARHNGIADGISALGRFRLGVKVPVVSGHDNTPVGEGDVIARLVGAFGRWAPAGQANGSAIGSSFPISGYSTISGAASKNNEGLRASSLNNGVITGLNTRQNLYVESAYYKQHLKSGIPILTDLFPGADVLPNNDNFRTTADIYAGVIPWRNLFNRSPYRGDDLNQFQNTSLVNNPGMLANSILPTLAIAWHQGLGQHLSADLTGAVRSLDTASFLNGYNVSEEVGLNYDTAFLGARFTKPGNVYVGGYHFLFNGNNNPAREIGVTSFTNRLGVPIAFGGKSNNAVHAFYAGWNQEWWRGIGTSVDYVLNKTGPNNVLITSLLNGTGANASFNLGGNVVGIQQALTAVLSLPLSAINPNLTNRAKDAIGLGYGWIMPVSTGDNTTALNAASEHVVEGYYRWVVNNSVSIIPSMQMIMNRMGLGHNGIDWVFGLRTSYVF